MSWAAGAGTCWGLNTKCNKSVRVWGKQDNLRAELLAVILALQMTSADQSLEISTCSQFAIRAA
ncbi:hypothetical protein B0H19DRAFT_948311 [Mycena capillaripes]|nr:hypothetical protein B0H19DRAFT_948311 [Mycena capillaripes]